MNDETVNEEDAELLRFSTQCVCGRSQGRERQSVCVCVCEGGGAAGGGVCV